MAQTEQQQDEQPRVDDQGNEIDMSAHIPEGTEEVAAKDIDPDDRDMSAKHNELGEGLHPTSVTFGQVVSDYATDAAGNTPEDIAAQTELSEQSSDDTGKDKTKSTATAAPTTTSTSTSTSTSK